MSAERIQRIYNAHGPCSRCYGEGRMFGADAVRTKSGVGIRPYTTKCDRCNGTGCQFDIGGSG